MSPRVVVVIENDVLRGEGTQNDVARVVTEYWTLDGTRKLAECDEWLERKRAEQDGASS